MAISRLYNLSTASRGTSVHCILLAIFALLFNAGLFFNHFKQWSKLQTTNALSAPGTTNKYMISPFVRKSLALGARTGPAELVLLSAIGGTGGIGAGGVAVACNEGALVKHSKTHHFSPTTWSVGTSNSLPPMLVPCDVHCDGRIRPPIR